MGLETITELHLRKNWKNFIDFAHKALKENDVPLEFTTFKNDGSYSKAKSGTPAIYFVFAQDSSRRWVELELKPRTSKGQRYSQIDLYSYLKQNYVIENVNGLFSITWNEEDLQSSPRNPDGLDIRIKIYIEKQGNEQWVIGMIQLSKSFLPLLSQYKKHV